MKKKLVGLILGTVMTITTLGGTSVMAADDGLTFAIVYPNIFPFFDAIGNGAEDKIEEMGQNITLIKEGAQKAERIANRTLDKVQKKIGFPLTIR